jgi:hypothetical protein
MQEYFFEIAAAAGTLLAGAEVFTASFAGEESDFVRFNRGETRQAGTVVQRHLTVDLVEGQRHAAGTLTLTGDLDSDVGRLRELVTALREMRVHLPEDPYLSYATEVRSTERVHRGELPDRRAILGGVRDAGRGRDLYRLLGENLIGLTTERETLLDPGTYHARSTASARLPGVLVEDFTFTL